MGITGTWSIGAIPFERRCGPCGALLKDSEASPCEKCSRPAAKRQRGATKATLAHRAKMLGICPDCGMLKSICFTVGGCQPATASRGQMLAAVLKVARVAKCRECLNETASNDSLPSFHPEPTKSSDVYYCGCNGWE